MIQINISHACQSWGQCVFDAPDTFKLEDSERTVWKYTASSNDKAKIKLAAIHCPNRAISFREVND
jgi:ferredoxin